jgi:hypothetical protein
MSTFRPIFWLHYNVSISDSKLSIVFPFPLMTTRAYIGWSGTPSMLIVLHAHACMICSLSIYENVLWSWKRLISRFQAFKRLKPPWVLLGHFGMPSVRLSTYICVRICTTLVPKDLHDSLHILVFKCSFFLDQCSVNIKITYPKLGPLWSAPKSKMVSKSAIAYSIIPLNFNSLRKLCL